MRFSVITISFLLSVLFFTHIIQFAACPATLPEQYEHIKPGKVVAAYFAGVDIYRKVAYSVEDMYPIAHKLTHIIYAFAAPNPKTGLCELSDLRADIGITAELLERKKSDVVAEGNFEKLLKLKQRHPHIKILLSVGGGTYSKYISEIAHKGGVLKFAQSCIDVLDRYEYKIKGEERSVVVGYEGLFDGIDIDWEWKNAFEFSQTAQDFIAMISFLRKSLDARSLQKKTKQFLTCALQANISIYKSISLSNVASLVDWINVMTYDFAGKFSQKVGLNAPLCNSWSIYSIDKIIHGLMNKGISPEKLVLGIPLYGHVFDKTDGSIGASFEKTQHSRSLSYRTIKEKYLQNKACKYNWHNDASAPSLYCSADKQFVSFDDEKSIRKKVDYAYKNRLKGVVLWRLAHDDEDHSLVHAIQMKS